MIKKQMTDFLLAGALCLLAAALFTGCAKSSQTETPGTVSSTLPDTVPETDSGTASGTAQGGVLSSGEQSGEAAGDQTETSSASDSAGQEDTADAALIEDQTFTGISLGDYENVQFTTREITDNNGHTRAEYSLVSDGSVVYTFPDAYPYWQFASEVNFVVFRDINGDGQKDVITSEQYITGTKEEGAVPFSMARIYLNQGGEFLFAEGLSVSVGNYLNASVPEEYTLENILSILEEPVYCNFGSGGWSRGEIESFAFLVKNDVLNDNRQSLAQKINYPLNLVRNGETFKVSSPEEFLAGYNDILNLQVIYDVEGSETEDLFWNQEGVMLGTGAVWFGKMQDGSVKITAIPAEVQYCNPLNVD